MLGSNDLGPVARSQLAAWEDMALAWTLYKGLLTDRCASCDKGVILRVDGYGRPYRYTRDQELALIVLHLRNFHADLDPNG